MQNILQQKEEIATQRHKLNGYDDELKTQITRIKSKICELFVQAGKASRLSRVRFGLQKIANVTSVPELRYSLSKLESLKVLRRAA